MHWQWSLEVKFRVVRVTAGEKDFNTMMEKLFLPLSLQKKEKKKARKKKKNNSVGHLDMAFFLNFNYRPLVRQISLQEL